MHSSSFLADLESSSDSNFAHYGIDTTAVTLIQCNSGFSSLPPPAFLWAFWKSLGVLPSLSTFYFLSVGKVKAASCIAGLCLRRKEAGFPISVLMWVSSPSYPECFGLLFPHLVNGTDVYLMRLCLEALIFLLVVVANDNVASLPERRAVAGCSQLLCQACLVLVHSGAAARDCLLHGSSPWQNQQLGVVSFFSFLRLCRTKDGVTDTAVFESCHLLC